MSAVLELLGVKGIVWVQDGGRRGFAHHGVPEGGPVCPERLAQANLAVGNAWDAPAFELWGMVEVRLTGDRERALFDGRRVVRLGPGQAHACGAGANEGVRYAAVEGGLDVPEVLGGRGTLPLAHLGGHEGRALRRGDVLPLGAADEGGMRRLVTWAPSFQALTQASLRFVPEPGAPPEAVEALSGREGFRISPTSDRIGTRLVGTVPGGGARIEPAPMVRGTIQLPPSGEPIVLGPDHPTTGGYPVLGVVIRADLGLLGAMPAGGRVHFEPIDLPTARRAWVAWSQLWTGRLR